VKRLPVLVGLLALVRAGGARAETAVQANATVSAAWTDNWQGTGGASNPNDFYTDLRPSLILQTATPRTLLRLGYSFVGVLHFQDASNDSYSNHLDVTLARQLSRRTTVTLLAGATQGGIILQLTQRDPAAAQPGFLPAGNPDLLTVHSVATVIWEATPHLRVTPSLIASMMMPITSPHEPLNYTVEGGAALDRLWQQDSLGGELRIGYVEMGGSADATGMATPTRHALQNRLLLRWRHDLGYNFISLIAAGLNQVVFLPDGGGAAPQPAALASLSYVDGLGNVGVYFEQGTHADLLTGAILSLTHVSLRGGLPLGRRLPMILRGSVGYQYGDVISSPIAGDTGSGHAVLADVGLAITLRDELLLTARYNLAYQVGHGSGVTAIPSVLHNTAMVGLTVRYPGAPFHVAEPNLNPMRVDGSDARDFQSAHAPLLPPPPEN
jgi:hypothetical protein